MRKRIKKSILRSTSEDRVKAQLLKEKVKFKYEGMKISYLHKPSTYTPDFILPNGIIVEVKGHFTREDRAKHKQIKSQHPELDIRFVFDNSNNYINTDKKTTYGEWCKQFGFKYADWEVPKEWLDE